MKKNADKQDSTKDHNLIREVEPFVGDAIVKTETENDMLKIKSASPEQYAKFEEMPLKNKINQISLDLKEVIKLYSINTGKAIEKISSIFDYLSKGAKGQAKKRIRANIVVASLESSFLYLNSNKYFNYYIFEALEKKIENVKEIIDKIA